MSKEKKPKKLKISFSHLYPKKTAKLIKMGEKMMEERRQALSVKPAARKHKR